MLKVRKTEAYIAYILLGVILALIAVMLAPIWTSCGSWCFYKNWGKDILHILTAIVIICYLIFYLSKKVMRAKGNVKTLTIIEFIVMALVALGLVLSQFRVFNISGACRILGLAVCARGIVEACRGYFYRGNTQTYRFPFWYFLITLALIILGTYMMLKPFFTDTHLLWAVVIGLFVYGIALIVVGILSKPGRKK